MGVPGGQPQPHVAAERARPLGLRSAFLIALRSLNSDLSSHTVKRTSLVDSPHGTLDFTDTVRHI